MTSSGLPKSADEGLWRSPKAADRFARFGVPVFVTENAKANAR
ncbi:hypothetical protein ORV05_17765 [Amycolatopsis cynarae]|uniref:Uncharacterized protein n=1 Tax=Amycolatopsis cynarae TaxID=2995223 RepID=A0ABY7BAZ8_9PSEU|nr:hypothetical protein [Amycolatopsis sp. HUAS 11-8]WAL69540.1 hypothetical protein ORV05_17765 [Amycolatopsis sp. HUAS 11-8]